MRKHWIAGLVGAAIAALATTWLVAQPITQNQLTGNECWNAGQGAGGPTAGFLCTNVMRNGTANAVLSAMGGAITIGAATNVTFVSGSGWGSFPSSGINTIITAQPTAGAITMPPSPVTDGAVVRICNGTNSAWSTNVVTVAANTNQTMVPTGAAVTLTTLAAATCVGYQFSLSNTSWYKVQ
jgi:hypothetical protein